MTLKLFYSPASPFVRKVLVCAHEKGVAEQIENLPSKPGPVHRDPEIMRENPAGQVPTAITRDGTALFDSRVICAFVDTMSSDMPLLPTEPKARFAAMTLEALADTMLTAAVLCRYETALRPAQFYWDQWYDGQIAKIDSGLDDLESRWIDTLNGPVSIGTITVACVLGYLDFRFADRNWRAGHPELSLWFGDFAKRASMKATMPA